MRSTCACVAWIDELCGSVMSIVSSGRSDAGKNCCGTKRSRNSDTTNAPSVTPIVSHGMRIAPLRKLP